VDGASLPFALDQAEAILAGWADSEPTLTAVRAGRRLGACGVPTPESIELLGGGWVGEEARAIGVACAVGAADVGKALLAAVNHSGDSDSTGAITGNLLGASGGRAAIPAPWLESLELREVIEPVARDPYQEFRGEAIAEVRHLTSSEWFTRYPPG
jgi:hypothetical protein